ncbi:MAG: FHA domain-containing protein, partial [Planctomycetota bacterium]
MPAKLTVQQGRQAGTELTLEGKAVFDIGSAPGAAGFKLEGAGIAANHIRIFREEKKFTLFDLNGQGVTVNGQKIQKPTVLSEGDEIGVGTVSLKFASVAGSGAAPRSTSDAAAPQGLSRPVSEAIDAPALLYCLEGTDKGKVWPLSTERDSFTMGRGVNADVVIMDIKCSREHCRVERRGKEYVVVDLGSTNGTKINGVKMKQNGTLTLKWNDQIRVGYSTIELRAAAAEGATAPTAKLGDKDKLPGSSGVVNLPPAAPAPTPRPAAPVPPSR